MQPRSSHHHFVALLLLAAGAAALACHGSAHAGDYDEAVLSDLSGNHLAPSFWQLTDGPPGSNGFTGNNVLSGRTGRTADVVDRDYVNFRVPVGFELVALRVGNSTTSGGAGGSFIGLARGAVMPIAPVLEPTSAAGLLGWRHYSTADRNTDILPAMGGAGQGATGFAGALPAGDYTLWIQELANGSFNYRFNLQVSAVPEPASAWLLALGLGLAVAAAQRRR